MSKNIGILVGSLRKGSYSRKVARILAGMLPKDYRANFIEFGHLELYNQDYEDEGTVPCSYREFRDTVRAQDAILFVTPEYNRSIPAGLKNALDIGSRPYGQSSWNGKPAAVVSVSLGSIGAFGANHHLRQVLTSLNMPTLQHPEAYVGNIAVLLNGGDTIANEDTLRFLQSVVDAFAALIQSMCR
jgi:chromate reductase